MSRLQEVRDARLEVAKKAAKRWKERTAARAETQRQLRRGGPMAGNSAEAIADFQARFPIRAAKALRLANIGVSFIERVIGTPDFSDTPSNSAERLAGRSVARVVEIHGRVPAPRGFGTGFMIAPQLLMTNHHVFEHASQTVGCAVQFGHEKGDNGLMPGETFELDADTFFHADQGLDYAIVAVKSRSLEGSDLARWGYHALIRATGKILKGHPISIIQHPDGGHKRYASVNNQVVDLLDWHLHYSTDTRPGSSGSPGFNNVFEVVALHHSGVPAMDGETILNDDGKPWSESEGEDAIDWIANEGVRISRILAHLDAATFADESKRALRDSVLRAPERFLPAEAEVPGVEMPTSNGLLNLPPAPVRPDWSQAHNGDGPVINVQGDATINFGPAGARPSPPAQVLAPTEAAPSRSLLLEKKLKRDPNYGRRRGYDPNFLFGFDVPVPRVQDERATELVVDRHGNPLILDYHHYSLTMNKDWLLQMWSAVNVDYSPEVRFDIPRDKLGTDEWIHDPRIPESLQIDDPELYAPAKKFDRGHIVRRDDSAWGVTQEEMEYANSDTFHWTNCTPQHEDFNRAIFGHKGIWGMLENHIAGEAEAVGNRLVLFAGPVLDVDRAIPHDFGGGRFRVPLDYWKVVLIAEKGSSRKRPRLRAYGFLLEQKKAIDRFGLERLRAEERFDVGEFEPQQRSLADLMQRTEIVFAEEILDADILRNSDQPARPIESLERMKL